MDMLQRLFPEKTRHELVSTLKKTSIIDLVVYKKQLGMHTHCSVLPWHIVYTMLFIMHTHTCHLNTHNTDRRLKNLYLFR